MNRSIKLISGLLASLLLFTACSGGPDSHADIGSGIIIEPPTSATSADNDGDSSATSALGDIPVQLYVESSTRAVVISNGVEVFDAPDGQTLTMLSPTTDFGTSRVLLVEDEQADWVKVRLPSRPNHRSGWVRAASVETEALELAVYVDLQTRTLSVRSDEGVILQSPITIGTADNPTPRGTFSITDKLETPEPGGVYGPYALGLSGHSETLTEFGDGDGQIGIHGTNDPASIGQAVSHGCVRVPNDVIEQLATLLPLGTPVHVV